MCKRNQDSIVVAIYVRKSKLTGKGESIKNQIKKCREYVQNNPVEDNKMVEFIEYADEGISGKSLDRPQMSKLLLDISDKKIDVLICYRLDRISRNVKDFSELITKLNDLGVKFVSVNERFDTRTPMGTAMMYISSVFAQLERETIAERIQDNMQELAKKGIWLGGRTPLGFASQKVENSNDGKKRFHYCLTTVKEESDIVNFVYEQYIKLGSLTRLEAFLLDQNIMGRDGKPFSRYVLRALLMNPVYCKADLEAFQYLTVNHYGIYGDEELFNGTHGMIAYNKNDCHNKNHQRVNEVREWIVAVGEHEGIIESKLWIKVQEQMKENAKLSFRHPKSIDALLSGILRCNHCGSYMRPKGGRRTKDGEKRFYYVCECKEHSHGQKCKITNLSGNMVDTMVVNWILELKNQIIEDDSYLVETIKELKKQSTAQSIAQLLQKQIEDNDRQITNLLDHLGRCSNEMTSAKIVERMDMLAVQQEKLKKQYEEEEAAINITLSDFDCEILSENLLAMNRAAWDLLSIHQQKNMLRNVIKEISWDGTYATVHLCAEEV